MSPLDKSETTAPAGAHASQLDDDGLRCAPSGFDAAETAVAFAPNPAGAKPADTDLVAGCLRGEASCWEALVRRYQRLVFVIVGRIGLDEQMAADVFQTVFSRLLAQLPKIDDPTRLQAWIVTTTKREALLQRRRGERWVSMTSDGETGDVAGREWEFADDSPIAEEALSELQQLNLVRLGLDRLDPRCRRLLQLLFADHDIPIAYEDVAAQLGMALGSVGPTRARCLAKLRRCIG